MKLQSVALIFALVAVSSAAASTIVKVTGRVVDAKGNSIAGARIAERWFSEEGGALEPTHPAVSDKDGCFSLEVELDDRDTIVMAMDATGRLGGMAMVFAKSPTKPIHIPLSPLVEARVRYASESADRSLGDTYITWLAGDQKLQVANGRSRSGEFIVKLPPGRYTVSGDESHHLESEREITLESSKPVDLGEIKLRLTPLARLFGKPAPPWHFTDARGVSKNIQPADFKGKWVVLEFWGYWCGPCLVRGLPGWMDFVEDHAADRDRFVVLAVHDPQAADFAMLDEKLEPIIRRVWRGRRIPFPILLDTSGQTVKDYAIEGWPTAVLIDPEGSVVDVPAKRFVMGSWACEDFLASKLTPLPAHKQIARALDRTLSLSVDEDQTLAELVDFFGTVGRTKIRLDPDELLAAETDKKAHVHLRVEGSLTLRAWLNLTFEPLGLTYVADGDGLRIVRRMTDNIRLSQPSARQLAENALIVESLQKKVTLEVKDESLKQFIETLESKTEETFLIDPVCRKAGTIDPDRVISGSVADEALSSALKRLLSPLGLKFVVQNEAVVLTTKSNAKGSE
jgi:thiol-disulfide isomerase/thioredoxin